VAALDVFVVVYVVYALVPKFLDEGAGVGGVYAVVFGGGGDEEGGIAFGGVDVVVGRVFVKEIVPVGCVGVSVFGLPGGSGEEVRVALHVDEGHGAYDGAVEVGPLDVGVGDEEPAVGAAADGEFARVGDDARGDEIFSDGVEVVVAFLSIFFEGRLVPARSVFAAAS